MPIVPSKIVFIPGAEAIAEWALRMRGILNVHKENPSRWDGTEPQPPSIEVRGKLRLVCYSPGDHRSQPLALDIDPMGPPFDDVRRSFKKAIASGSYPKPKPDERVLYTGGNGSAAAPVSEGRPADDPPAANNGGGEARANPPPDDTTSDDIGSSAADSGATEIRIYRCLDWVADGLQNLIDNSTVPPGGGLREVRLAHALLKTYYQTRFGERRGLTLATKVYRTFVQDEILFNFREIRGPKWKACSIANVTVSRIPSHGPPAPRDITDATRKGDHEVVSTPDTNGHGTFSLTNLDDAGFREVLNQVSDEAQRRGVTMAIVHDRLTLVQVVPEPTESP